MELAIDRGRSAAGPQMEETLEAIRKGFRGRAEELIPLLQRAQGVLGFLPEAALLEIARLTGLPAAKVFGAATFYSQFRLRPVGRYVVRVCRGTACHVKGSERILERLQDHLGVIPGETTPDGLFTIETVACFGSCALAPILVVNEAVHGSVSRAKAVRILDGLRAKAEPVAD